MKTTGQIFYKISVLENGARISHFPRKKNLILDQGLDNLTVLGWTEAFSVAAVGTGTDPTRRDTGATTLTRTASTVTASAGFFIPSDVGRIIKWNTGEEARITVYNSGTEVITAENGTIAADQATVWYVNRTGLAAESKRTNTYGSDAGDNGSTFLIDTWTHKRTFIFSAEASPITYREVGWSHTTIAGANLFGLDLLAGAGVSLATGQQLKIEVELSVQYGPASSAPWVNVIGGWTADGDHGIIASSVSIVNSAGPAQLNSGIAAPLEPNQSWTKRVCLASNTTAPAPMTSAGSIDATGVIFAKNLNTLGYVTGTFTRDFSATFEVGEANSTEIRSISLGFLELGANRTCYKVLLNAAETKNSDHTLTITFTLTWGRTLTN